MLDLAWAAGVFEGEGSVAATAKLGTNVSISQKDKWLVQQFQALFGGSLYRIAHLTPKGAPSHFWLWAAYGSRGRGFLFTVYSFLSPRRRRQVDAVILRWRSRIIDTMLGQPITNAERARISKDGP